jgi:DNA-binding NtrC family response regulator/tetratricopeptide (TPR) repeat protein
VASLSRLQGESAPIAAVRDQAARMLRHAAGPGRRLPPILILGETGTGKGLLADAIHRDGARAAGPFVDVNCAAIPETLLEAELFGFERGAFTDAHQAKAGLFQAANGGTIFLDEAGLLPIVLQSKLLKVIEERSVRRLGSTRSEPLDVAIIAATSEDLVAAVQEGRFRADLYHRLAVVTLALPPLRARGRDVLVLAEDLLARICEDYGLATRVLTEDAQAALLAYGWPGNVRELANVLERASLLSDDHRLSARDLGLAPAAPALAAPDAHGAAPAEHGDDADAESERRVLLEVLGATRWNFTRAASRLGLPRNTLRYRVERLGLAPEGPSERRRGGRPPSASRAPAPPAPTPRPEPLADTRRVTLLQLRLSPTAASGWEANRGLERSTAKVRSFGGRIEATGAGEVLAAFGLEPDEDAVRRAAYAALAVRTLAARARGEGGDAPFVTAALHTDLMPVTREGDLVSVDAGARDDARGRLDALLATAAPGTVVATAAASRFLARRFDLVPLEDGGGACRVVQHAERGRTRFVGRARELRLLGDCFERAQAGHGQVVMIAGEPGIGKSRLLREFRRQLGRRATWVEGHALSFGRSMPFHPVIDMTRRVCRVDDADSEPVIVAKIERAVRRLGDDVAETLAFVRYLLSVDPGDPTLATLDPERRHAAIVRATHVLIERGTELRTHVIVLEDVHWCDPATEDWITRLSELIAAKRALLILTYRPGYRPPLGSRSFHTALALSTLSGEESLRIAGGLLEADDLPPALQALVLDKAEGNPFFIEELVRSLEEVGAVQRTGERTVTLTTGLDHVAVPDTVQEVILARTDRLDEGLRHVLEVASVIGKNVPFPVLRAVAGRSEEQLVADLGQLQAAEFLHETRGFPEVEHTFKHALTHDVAYGRVRPELRRALHARIVAALERLYPDRLDEHVERLAYHAVRGELWPKALRYSHQGGAKAFNRSANREAVASLEQALAAVAHLPQTPETLAEAIDIRLLLRGALLQLAELERLSHYLGEAETLALKLGDHRRLAWVWIHTTTTHLLAGDPIKALGVGEKTLALAEQVGGVGLRASARTPLAHTCRELGDMRRSITLFRETIEALAGDLARERHGQAMPPAFQARSMMAYAMAELGEFDEAARIGVEAAALSRSLDLPFSFALAHMALCHVYLMQERVDEAVRVLEPALEKIETRGLLTWTPWASALRGYALALSGRAEDGRVVLVEALAQAAAMRFLIGQSRWVVWLAHASLLAGRLDEARASGEEALRLTRRRGERAHEAWALYVLGEIEGRGGAAARPAAEALYRQALGRAGELGLRPLADRCRLALGRPPG